MGEGPEEQGGSERSIAIWAVGLVISLAAFGMLWLLVAPSAYRAFGWDDRALTLSDVFAPLGTILAAIALVYAARAMRMQARAMEMQAQELQLQRKELALQRSELQKTSAALEAQVQHASRAYTHQVVPLLRPLDGPVRQASDHTIRAPGLTCLEPHPALDVDVLVCLFKYSEEWHSIMGRSLRRIPYLVPDTEYVSDWHINLDLDSGMEWDGNGSQIIIAQWRNAFGGTYRGAWALTMERSPSAFWNSYQHTAGHLIEPGEVDDLLGWSLLELVLYATSIANSNRSARWMRTAPSGAPRQYWRPSDVLDADQDTAMRAAVAAVDSIVTLSASECSITEDTLTAGRELMRQCVLQGILPKDMVVDSDTKKLVAWYDVVDRHSRDTGRVRRIRVDVSEDEFELRDATGQEPTRYASPSELVAGVLLHIAAVP